MPMSDATRRYDLDWLRVIAFLLLILFHTGMFFVPWSFHFKNRETSELFELWMTPLNQFRLPLLFITLRHRTIGAYLKERSLRLLLPLLFGMLVIVPPQIFFENQYKGAHYASYWQFYPKVWEFIPYPQGSFCWHHLWYIPYIFVYPIYILHQSVMIVFGYYILQTSLGIVSKFVFVALSTFCGSLLLYEGCVKRWNPVRILFGLKPINKTVSASIGSYSRKE